MQRNTYVKKHDGYFSKQNEPLTGVQMFDKNYYEYPDMKKLTTNLNNLLDMIILS